MSNCDPERPSSGDRGVSIPLTVLPADRTSPPKVRKSKNGPRRAIVLGVVHLLFAAHISQWLASGSTVSPVEPSESMKTLELGQVNAGAIFFAVAILSTLVFGRFFCGWGCHVVALQDLCAWMMKKCGVRPKPFRSRLLVFIPLALALYMFVWPTFKREALAPVLEGVWPGVRADLGVTPFPDEGFTNHLMTEGFWDTFAPPMLAVPFLLICGFACVYFLGAKGFCTYGCPYGGFFAPADLVSPGKIVVDLDKCHQCGHCTAVCTSNVRVHEEIREFGMVVDPGCMKCLDCVSVCPNTALSFGFARPTIAKGAPRNKAPKKNFDTTRAEDWSLALVFLACLLCWRGAYAQVPLLMAAGIAGCLTFLAWKCWRTLRERDARFSVFQLKRLGRLTRAGWCFVALFAVAALATGHNGFVSYHMNRAGSIYESLNIPKQRALAPGPEGFTSDEVRHARRGLRHYALASSWRQGGAGLLTPRASELRAALLHLVAGEPDKAEAAIRRATSGRHHNDEAVADLLLLKLAQGRAEEALALGSRTLAEHPDYWATREQWAMLMQRASRSPEALADTERALALIPPERFTREAHARTRLILARLLVPMGRGTEALAHLREAVSLRPKDAVLRENLAAATMQIERDLPGALAQMGEAVRLAPSNHRMRLQYGQILLQAGRADEAIVQFEELERRDPGDAQRRAFIGRLLDSAGRPDDAASWK